MKTDLLGMKETAELLGVDARSSPGGVGAATSPYLRVCACRFRRRSPSSLRRRCGMRATFATCATD